MCIFRFPEKLLHMILMFNARMLHEAIGGDKLAKKKNNPSDFPKKYNLLPLMESIFLVG